MNIYSNTLININCEFSQANFYTAPYLSCLVISFMFHYINILLLRPLTTHLCSQHIRTWSTLALSVSLQGSFVPCNVKRPTFLHCFKLPHSCHSFTSDGTKAHQGVHLLMTQQAELLVICINFLCFPSSMKIKWNNPGQFSDYITAFVL